MAKRGRPRKAMESICWTIYVPKDVALKVDTLIMDPLFAKVKYGFRSQLVTTLLREWLEKQRKSSIPTLEEEFGVDCPTCHRLLDGNFKCPICA